ncbi:MAG TPA: AraC family transcriptional regulator [Acetobacteraceae bacterium]|nr:AraC family transcriptional regulator [Acetobacteraceae bacterium]
MARTDPHNRTRYWQAAAIPGLTLLHADFTRHDYVPHSHDALVIAATEAGGSEFKSRGRTEEATESRLLVFNPAEPHSGRMARSRRWRYRSLYLNAAALAAVTRAVGTVATPYFAANVFADADLVSAFVALHRALEPGNDLLCADEWLAASFGTLLRRHATEGNRVPSAPRDQPLLHHVISLMQAAYAQNLTLDRLAGEIGVTPFQVIGLFKRGTGLTPHAYLTQLRLRAAIRQLRAGQPIAQTSASCGFYDQAALTTHFKRAYGITPLQFVRAQSAAVATPRNFGQ